MSQESKTSARDAVHVCVQPVPSWIDPTRWLGPFPWELSPVSGGARRAQTRMGRSEAAWLSARLRGLGIDGVPVTVEVEPPLARDLVRAARLREARARRDTTPGFLHRAARASGEGRYSLTPEPLALAMAAEVSGWSVVDACCGSGGNAIAFARAGCQVTAIDISAERLAEARHNARVYGVEQKLRLVQADALEQVPHMAADLLFIDPPWGQDYDKRATTLASVPLLQAFLGRREDLRHYREIWLKLPASFATATLPSAEVRAWFGEAPGDAQRVKFLQVKLTQRSSASS